MLRRWGLPVLLFALTSLTTSYAGAFWAGLPVDVTDLPRLWREGLVGPVLRAGLPFSATLMSVLTAHEFGHFFASRRRGVACTPPYFIPMPLLLGTLGAVIRMRGRIPSRAALLEIGASGPWAGFVVAVPALAWGLAHSTFEPAGTLPDATFAPTSLAGLVSILAGLAPDPGLASIEPGRSVLYALFRFAFAPDVPEGAALALHPAAVAAWFGLFVTALNLLPIGQFDGGHVAFALFGEGARKALRPTIAALALLGVFAWAGWILWAVIGWRVARGAHPPVEHDAPLEGRHRALAWASLALFPLVLVPVPIGLR